MVNPGSGPQITEGAAIVVVPAAVVIDALEALANALGLRAPLRITGIGRHRISNGTFAVRVDGLGLPPCAEGRFPDSVPLEDLVDVD